MGLNTVRFNFSWIDYCPSDKPNCSQPLKSTSERINNLINTITGTGPGQYGMYGLWVMGGARKDQDLSTSIAKTNYKKFVTKMSDKFASNDKLIWEVWNEPD